MIKIPLVLGAIWAASIAWGPKKTTADIAGFLFYVILVMIIGVLI